MSEGVQAEMNILVAFNDGYVMPTKVMLQSLIMHHACDIHVYCLYGSLSEESVRSISELNDGEKVVIEFVKVDDGFLSKVPTGKYYAREAYYRLFAQNFLDSGIERILWLDGDIIVNGSLEEFYGQPFEDKIYISVIAQNLGNNAKKKQSLNMPSDAFYINSGVMLINLNRARAEINDDAVLQYINRNQDLLEFVDQDVFNGLLYPYIKVISQDNWYNYSVDHIKPFNKKRVYEKARIIHYCVTKKPWRKGYTYLGFFLWWKHARMGSNEYRKLYHALLPDYLWSRAKRNVRGLVLKTKGYAKRILKRKAKLG